MFLDRLIDSRFKPALARRESESLCYDLFGGFSILNVEP
ncbi:hypothetical protein D1BOALGB6SA_10538 [Olavius sp. associated proteobacterium Delta 1]|nr:hypothetical protein D1BOALGB6SA_10538 [Olavius sp. associated proteobacterium Delta 1]